MIKIKSLTFVAVASSTLFFSGCVPHNPNITSTTGSYYSDGYATPSIQVSLGTYGYPHYYDRPYYFFNGLYYYGGIFRNGFYHYENQRFRHGHYYNHGYRYYNGRRYKARNGRYGHYINKKNYQRSHIYQNKQRRVHKGRNYNRNRNYATKVNRTHTNVPIKSDRYRKRKEYSNNSNNRYTNSEDNVYTIVRNRANYARHKQR